MDGGKPLPAGFRPELVLKPVIQELARTQVCFPDLKLLVDRISIVALPSTEHTTVKEAYRLYLTDGERTIQAVLKRNCHKHVTSFDVREGSYVILRNYRLARGRKLSGVGSVIYVIIEDFYSIGEQPRDDLGEVRRDRYIELIKNPQRQSIKPIDQRHRSTARRILDAPEGKHQGNNKDQDDPFSSNNTPNSSRGSSHERDFMSKGLKRRPSASPIASARSEQKKRKRDDPFGDIDLNLKPRDFKPNKPLEETFSVQKTSTGPNMPSILEHDRPSITKDGGVGLGRPADQSHVTPTAKLDTAGKGNSSTKSNNGAADLSSPDPRNRANRPPTFITRPIDRTKAPIPIKRPLQLRTLESLTGQHATRNKVHDVFAVICSVDASVIKPASMPPKRDMRIMDRSTDKKVLVSVFVDPAHFQPAVGTVALFRSLTTHEWDRGMLNAYPQQCGGKAWFVPDPVGVPGCDVDGLKGWWRRTSKTEMEAVETKAPPQ